MLPPFRPLTLATLFLAALASSGGAAEPARLEQSLDAGWRFSRGDFPSAAQPAFDDTSWRHLDIPHDWSIEGPFDEKNPTAGAGAFLPSGVAWYRKNLTLPADAAHRRIFVEFDGVMQNSEVWINGVSVGQRPFGYASFRYELTDHIKAGQRANLLAVRADTSAQPASRWYSGAGIYRHVRLIVTDPVHHDYHTTFVSTPSVTADSATVRVQSTVVNQSEKPREVYIVITLVGPDGKAVGTAPSKPLQIAAGQSADFLQEITVDKPRQWSLEDPALCRAIVSVRSGKTTLDDETVTFGIRDAHFEPATGFWLNGKNIKLKGVALHHDASAFGAAVPLAAWERRLATLRELGVNAIRTAHNPPAPEFLDLCDRLGFLVMDELFDCWTVGKPTLGGQHLQDYHLYFNEWSQRDTRDTVRRDRNHPSVILYSAGNEIHDTPNAELSKKILSGLVQVFHENDSTRPVTQALFRPNVTHDYDNGLADLLDVIGTNYRDAELLAAWRAKPTRIIVGTEQRQDRETWLLARDHPPHSGQFLWTGVDYLGESRGWPRISSSAGLVDRIGVIKPNGRERQSWWSGLLMVAIARRGPLPPLPPADPAFVPPPRRPILLSDWTPQNPAAHDEEIEVYSNAESVELFLNHQSLGSKPLNADASPREWKIRYAPGTLKAIATTKGQIVATEELRTAGPPAKIILSTGRAKLTPSWDDVAYVVATVVDANGVRVPDAGDLIAFKITGPGVIAAVDSADLNSHEPFQGSERHAFQGQCVALVKANAARGNLVVTAAAPHLAAGTVTLQATASP